jgi:hypothetical protein
MPQRLNMFITNGNIIPPQIKAQINTANLANIVAQKSSALNSSMISRIHNVRPGCGSCGRKNM